jgi:cysteine sulfinate desulfinase/cysteine desulfurase-like protein
VQPIETIASLLPRDTILHVDAAQGFGKEIAALSPKK